MRELATGPAGAGSVQEMHTPGKLELTITLHTLTHCLDTVLTKYKYINPVFKYSTRGSGLLRTWTVLLWTEHITVWVSRTH